MSEQGAASGTELASSASKPSSIASGVYLQGCQRARLLSRTVLLSPPSNAKRSGLRPISTRAAGSPEKPCAGKVNGALAWQSALTAIGLAEGEPLRRLRSRIQCR